MDQKRIQRHNGNRDTMSHSDMQSLCRSSGNGDIHGGANNLHKVLQNRLYLSDTSPETTKEILRNLRKQQTRQRAVVLCIPKCISSGKLQRCATIPGGIISELCIMRGKRNVTQEWRQVAC
jgi:hypothetical protein